MIIRRWYGIVVFKLTTGSLILFILKELCGTERIVGVDDTPASLSKLISGILVKSHDFTLEFISVCSLKARALDGL